MPTLTVPIVGTNVTPERGGQAANGATAPSTPVETQAETTRPSLHQVRMQPQEVPDQEYRWTFNQFGKAKLVPIEQAQAAEQVADGAAEEALVNDSEGNAGDSGIPPLPGSQHATAGQAAQGSEVGALQAQVQDLTQTVRLLLQERLQGQQPKQPQLPEAPDPTQFDFFDPAQLADFHRRNNAYNQAIVQHEVRAALEPHRDTMESAKWTAQYNQTLAAHGQDANFKARMDSALQVVAKNPSKFTIPEAYELVASLPISSPQQTAAPSPSAKPARTITAQEAAQKAEQAKRLPASNGVSGAGQNVMPSHIKGLGNIMAWNMQYGRAS